MRGKIPFDPHIIICGKRADKMSNTAIMVFENNNDVCDIEVPLYISANELLYGLNEGFNLGIKLEDSTQCYLCSENPIALLKGNRLLSEYGLHNGTRICYKKVIGNGCSSYMDLIYNTK